ncbi:hypothetical protein [Garciella nitratireducens]|uniref:Uncharacterized protein n=1 Tax=Garciella nitratireducens DSM 15102 TaxID=1121911 RepID=A0A1T4PDY6_9FIRM|nr:hypothetical protein [Garciella nitratireducens]RBP36675.1 hypothetical protein DFR81_1281 [Garciella nitratireducens]SJZ89764.1 hypothetical protein SAMN02745973_02041 [Garciella nitratireducens DSM 15102]
MLLGTIAGILVAWVLSLIGIDQLLIQGITEIFGKQIDISGYYTIFALIGLIGGAWKRH